MNMFEFSICDHECVKCHHRVDRLSEEWADAVMSNMTIEDILRYGGWWFDKEDDEYGWCKECQEGDPEAFKKYLVDLQEMKDCGEVME